MEAGGAASKRRRSGRVGRGVVADRISALPDAVLGEIVSLLPTSEGARTQILASRWRHIWRSAPLNLDCCGLAGVVPRILSSHQGRVRRFSVNAYNIGITIDTPNCFQFHHVRSSTVDAWLHSPVLDNLQELDVGYTLKHAVPVHPLPECVFRFSDTLRVVFFGNCTLSDSSTVQGLSFPKLQQLTLKRVVISEFLFNQIIAACPALERLKVTESFGFRCIRINSLSLICIIVGAKCYGTIQFRELIIENAPCLKRLLHLDQNAQSTEDLHVSVLSAPVLETLRCCLDNKRLPTKLSFGGSTIIQGSHVDSLKMAVRTVKILVVDVDTLHLDIFIELMRCFPCLEKLYIEVHYQSLRTNEKNLWRRKHRNIVRCLDIRFKTIVLQYYGGKKSDVNFLTFFVLNAKVLESITLVLTGKTDEFIVEQRSKLQLENRASRSAQFHFTTEVCTSFWADVGFP